jgi:hypothetical protein
MKRPSTLVIALFLSAPCAAEQICRYEDADGKVTYSTAAVKGARKTRCFDQYKPPAPPPRAAAAAAPGSSPKSASAAEASFPKVDAPTQKRRDDDRRRILEQELAEERDMLDKAKRALADAERAPADPLAPESRNTALRSTRDALTGHERNISAIEKELSRLR